MDEDEVADTLYALRPDGFTAKRAVYVARARKEGDRETARRIAALRRPVLAAWAANLLARHDHDATERFLQLGEDLREAQRELDGAALRELGHDRHRVVAALSRQAADLARDAGQPIAETVRQEVEQILRAVLADPEAAAVWAKGRLVTVPQPPDGFGSIDPVHASRRTSRPSVPESDGARAVRATAGHQEGDTADRRLAEARRASVEAEAEAEQRQQALELAQAERERAEEAETAASAAVDDLEEQIRRARRDQRTARTAARRAATAEQQARSAADRAHSTARSAGRRST
ncbi:hypothetical protein [Streptomyces albipurpureus]|uniref:Transposase n=1 Tax=Streptomyces albipurpureus TaxID=2897419 RepID=A0ABT0UI25_9ACTN|nr:hypothetical protein [Streptomyces sp. CWNU-1]MCM2388309.1 hypothetical protein [Streptomyces sp. CWNU-1]